MHEHACKDIFTRVVGDKNLGEPCRNEFLNSSISLEVVVKVELAPLDLTHLTCAEYDLRPGQTIETE